MFCSALDKVARYEAALERGYYRALIMLGRVQSARSGRKDDDKAMLPVVDVPAPDLAANEVRLLGLTG